MSVFITLFRSIFLLPESRLVEYLSLPDDGSYNLKIQAATILGSIAYGK